MIEISAVIAILQTTGEKKEPGTRFSHIFENSKMKILILVALVSIGAFGQKARFDNYRLYRLRPGDVDQIEALKKLEATGEYDFWTHPGGVNMSVDILVPPHKRPEFQDFTETHGIPNSCQIQNIQSLIDGEEGRIQSRCVDMDWTSYHKLNEIYDWIDEVVKKYKFAKKVTIGKTREGRKIRGLEICFNKNATGVFIESGMHGREWITPAATSFMVQQILDSPANSVFRNFTYYYIPLFNPDGYAYSWTRNRLWKKTRTPYRNGLTLCHGADPNRNWDFHWNETGTSISPCSENYPGPSPFSEIEMKSIASYLKGLAHSKNVDIYIAYHSYSQRLMYPWDHRKSPAPHRDLWQRIGEKAAADLKAVHGTDFEVGNVYELSGPATGSSREWFYGLFESTISFVYELRDKGFHGFLLPPEEIIPTGEEILFSLRRILIEYQALNMTNVTIS